MSNLYLELSRYLILFLAAFYTWYSFRYFTVGEEEAKARCCIRQYGLLLLLHGVSFSVLFLRTEELRYLWFYAAQLCFLLLYPALFRLCCRQCSALFLNHVCFFIAIGMVMLTRLSFSHAERQFGMLILGALLSLPVPGLLDRMWSVTRGKWLYAAAGIGLLFCVLLAGSTSYGAKMTLSLGGLSFQPSEFVKLSFVFFAASMLDASTERKQIVLTSLGAALHVLLLALCRDLGTALLFFTAYVVMLYIASGRAAYLVSGGAAFLLAGTLSYRLFSHVQKRVAAWRDPWSDITGSGYQVAHSLFAIGTGGWAGMGLLAGLPNRIPIVEKDFMFSAISEEMGAVTALCLILICLSCFLQMILTALYMDVLFYKLLAAGLSVIYVMQVFLTVGGAMKLIPSTGVTLPFVSYGGSSAVSSFLLFSVIQGLHLIMMRDAEEEAEEAEEAETAGDAKLWEE